MTLLWIDIWIDHMWMTPINSSHVNIFSVDMSTMNDSPLHIYSLNWSHMNGSPMNSSHVNIFPVGISPMNGSPVNSSHMNGSSINIFHLNCSLLNSLLLNFELWIANGCLCMVFLIGLCVSSLCENYYFKVYMELHHVVVSPHILKIAEMPSTSTANSS